MEGESSLILTVLKPVKIFVYDVVRDYVGYIGSCEDNLSALRKSLRDVCDKKDYINRKVKEGEDKQGEITRPAASWLKDVRILAADEELKSLMYKDVETAKFVVRLMGKKELKKLMRKDGEMQKLAVKVMNKLKEEMEKCEEEMREIAKVDYKMVAEVVVEVMKDTTEEFKKLMKKDKKLAVIATKMLKDRDLDKLTKDDKEMEDIVKEAGSVSDEDDEKSHPLLEEVPQVAEDKNIVREAATKLLTPLENLLTRLGKLMDDANFKNTVPKADDVKLVLDVIDGLLLKDGGLIKKGTDEDTRHHRSCRCCASDLSYYHNRYKLSIAAETMAKHIENDVIKNCPVNGVTVPIRSIDMKRSPTHFLKGLQSRDRLLQEILNLLKDDYAVGVYGMGGCGKTTLAKEVACKCVDMFSIMVEITESPDIGRIQGTIAESIGLPLDGVQNIAQRAIKLNYRLISEKEKKILIILDNIWEKLDLDDVGIPRTCKLLLTTREKDVCRLMGVKDANTRQVGLLDATEGKCLFQSQAGDKGDSEEYKTVIDRLLSKCGELPLAIVVTSNALKDKDLPYWQKFADELEKPLSFQLASGGHRETYSILSASYRIMESKEKRMFFLLCCLWSFGSNIPIKTIMRYAIGLGLFQHVNKLSEAMDQADRWADELMSSSMLLKSDSPGLLKIHDVVRAFGISIAAEDDGHKFLVDAIPRWMNKESLTEYTAISLLSDNDYSSLTGMVSNKLQILLLERTKMPDSPSSFSGRMMNLTVLYLGSMNFLPKLPESVGKLVKLRTLSLEKCKLGDIKLIGELVNLTVLCFLGSRLEELPNEIGKLINLRLLDLTDCTCKFPPDVTNILGGLSELEGLFMGDIFKDHVTNILGALVGKSYAPLAIEFNNLHYLNALEMCIWCAEQLSVDAQFVKNLDSFRISVNYYYKKYNLTDVPKVGSFRRILDVRGVDMGEHLGDNTLKALMKKADWLNLSETSNFSILCYELDEGLPELRHLKISDSKDVAFILNLTENLLVCPKLHSLQFENISELKGFCDGEASPGIFSNLHDLSLCMLDNLQYVLPFAPALFKLTRLEVVECKFLKFIFTDNASAQKQETNVMKLPFLKSLYLCSLNDLASLLGSENLSAIGDSVQEHQIFFNPMIELKALEKVTLESCNRILKLWDKELGISSFRSLRTIEIRFCRRLSSVGPLSIFSTLVQLERLTIKDCESIEEVITTEGTQELENRDQIVIFPQLKDLIIKSSSNLRSFYGGNCKLKFPNLKNLQLSELDSLNEFAGSENQSVLFHKEMDFPCLEELTVYYVNDEVMGLWDWGHLEGGSTPLLNPVPMLRTLTLGKIKGCRHIPPTVCKNVSFLELKMFDEELLLSLDKEGSVWTYSQLPNLKHLRVFNSYVLQDLVRSEDFEAAAALKFFEQFKTLKLDDLPRLKIFPLHLFKSLCSLELQGLSWDYAFSADAFVMLQESLQHLETLRIIDCKNMRVVIQVQDDGEGDAGLVFKFPRLKLISLLNSSVMGFSTTVNATLCLPSLERIYIYECDVIQHFWSGPIIAPKLKEVWVWNCKTIKRVLVGTPNRMVQLPSLMTVLLIGCPDLLCFSSGPLTALNLTDVRVTNCFQMQSFSAGSLHTPNLRKVEFQWKDYSMADFGMNLNHFIRSRYDIANPTTSVSAQQVPQL